ncbi:hypothetical protein [Micromonospora sp. Llam0]|uniref:hypothetical protein n=1 Tax=Micromonospora sp. Llam0 TaxID=2485143 RepID=UPI0011CE12CF|nr:hypothetical protein [Micromonospora sp. Llam0]
MSIVELVVVEILLRAVGAPAPLRYAILIVDAYGVLIALAVIAATVTRPHVIGPDEVRVRSAAFLDVRVPRRLVTGVRMVRNYNEQGTIRVDGDVLIVSAIAQTNLVVELAEPLRVVRPLGRLAHVRTIRFFADDPVAALSAWSTRCGTTCGPHWRRAELRRDQQKALIPDPVWPGLRAPVSGFGGDVEEGLAGWGKDV